MPGKSGKRQEEQSTDVITATPPGQQQETLKGKDVCIKDLNAYLTCKLCKGYLRDAHTLPGQAHEISGTA